MSICSNSPKCQRQALIVVPGVGLRPQGCRAAYQRVRHGQMNIFGYLLSVGEKCQGQAAVDECGDGIAE